MMMYRGNGIGAWGMALMFIGTLLFWGLIIVGIVALVRYTGRGRPIDSSAAEPSSPQRVLTDRFARGDIEEDEYAHRLLVLDGAVRSRTAAG